MKISERVDIVIGEDRPAHVDGTIQKVRIANINVADRTCICGKYENVTHGVRRGAVMVKFEDFLFSDEELSSLWKALGDIPIDDNECLEEPFCIWDVGTHREVVWKWFDEQHSRGVAEGLMFPENSLPPMWNIVWYEDIHKRSLSMNPDAPLTDVETEFLRLEDIDVNTNTVKISTPYGGKWNYLEAMEHIREGIKILNNTKVRRCNRCEGIVRKSQVDGYSYSCDECDEDLYTFETFETGEEILGQ